MTDLAEQLKTAVLQLPTQDRAELAYCLLRSLDEEEPGDLHPAWKAALERRWQEMESGAVAGRDSEEVFGELRNDTVH